MVSIAEAAGRRLLDAFAPEARPDDGEALLAAVRRNEEIASRGLRETLARLRPGAGWLDGDADREPLADGEWWALDAVEGNVNHVHGLREWGVALTLVRDRAPVAAVVHQALDALTWTALRGGGARCNGRAIRASAKSSLDAAIACTGQAEAGQVETYGRIGGSVSAMLAHVLLVRMSVPATFPLLQLACGQGDVFWQYAPGLSGIAAGLLIATEAGAVASRIDGMPWRPGAGDIVVAAPGLHGAAIDVLHAFDSREAA
jgi:myo-inositol-1(or 4)-monophosphatase